MAGLWLFEESAWDEWPVTVADLLPGWMLWTAGVSAAFSSRMPDPAFQRSKPWGFNKVGRDVAPPIITPASQAARQGGCCCC